MPYKRKRSWAPSYPFYPWPGPLSRRGSAPHLSALAVRSVSESRRLLGRFLPARSNARSTGSTEAILRPAQAGIARWVRPRERCSEPTGASIATPATGRRYGAADRCRRTAHHVDQGDEAPAEGRRHAAGFMPAVFAAPRASAWSGNCAATGATGCVSWRGNCATGGKTASQLRKCFCAADCLETLGVRSHA